MGVGAKIVETELFLWSSSRQILKSLDGLHGLGGLAVFLFFIVLYDLIEGYAELVDLHGPAFSDDLDLAFIDPVVLA